MTSIEAFSFFISLLIAVIVPIPLQSTAVVALYIGLKVHVFELCRPSNKGSLLVINRLIINK